VGLFLRSLSQSLSLSHCSLPFSLFLSRLGWKVVRKEMTATKFYFSRLFEAVPM